MVCWETCFAAAGGVQAKFEWVFGSQDRYARLSFSAFAANSGKVSLEAGLGLWSYFYLRRFGAAEQNWGLGYEAFALAGAGENENMLGATASFHAFDGFYKRGKPGDFIGIGFGISQDKPMGSLNKFGVRRGHAIIRTAHGNRSLHINFANDLRVGPFRGGAKDQGPTGSIQIAYSSLEHDRIRKYGLGADFFTPQPDYTKAPNNPINSDEGAKRTWFTTTPWHDLFHGNIYLMLGQQQEHKHWSAKLGIDSPKLGALIQNRIHDTFGLYPRYPWPVQSPNTFYIETALGTGSY